MFGHLVERLVGRGMLRREQQKRFLITRTVWPTSDISYKQDVRRHLAATLFDSAGGAHPTRRTATLIGHLAAVDQAHRLFVSPGVPPAYVRQRADLVSRGDWAAATVRGIFRASRSGSGGGGGGGGGGGDIGGGGDGGGGWWGRRMRRPDCSVDSAKSGQVMPDPLDRLWFIVARPRGLAEKIRREYVAK